MLTNPFVRPLGKRPNERKRSLWQIRSRLYWRDFSCLTPKSAVIDLLRKSLSKVPDDIPKARQWARMPIAAHLRA